MFEGFPGFTLCPLSDPFCGGYFTFPCDQPPQLNISLVFGKDKYDINPADLNAGQITTNSTDCLFAIGDFGNTTQSLVGDVFLRNYYTSYSPITQKVGFAQLREGGVYF